ncbi:hypothetical protein BHE74_00055818 [Ensete ventricosum]|nr:hypothetical protein BHE74_00055818 [Ensete ventricosum]
MVVLIPSEGSEDEGRSATTSPHVGPTTHGQVGCSQGPLQGGGWPRLKPLAREAASMRGRPRPALSPTRAVALAGAVPARCRSRATTLVAGAVVHTNGVQRRRQRRRRRRSESKGRGLGHPFEKMIIIPL